MIQFILDTDHVSLHERGHFPLRAKLASLPSDAIGVSVITVEEMLRGRLAVLARRTAGDAQVRAYAKFMETVEFFSRIPVLPFDLRCEQKFQELRATRIRIGSRALRIAATSLVYHVVLVTRNRRDFEQVPGIVIEDWSQP
jgi:tRNA(fMet)-specific endonuclease VapC